MTYNITYRKKTHGLSQTVRRNLTETGDGWLLTDGQRAIRPFDDLASAMVWIDEERRGV